MLSKRDQEALAKRREANLATRKDRKEEKRLRAFKKTIAKRTKEKTSKKVRKVRQTLIDNYKRILANLDLNNETVYLYTDVIKSLESEDVIPQWFFEEALWMTDWILFEAGLQQKRRCNDGRFDE